MYCGNCGKELLEYEEKCPDCNQEPNKKTPFSDVEFMSASEENVNDDLGEPDFYGNLDDDNQVSDLLSGETQNKVLLKRIAIIISVFAVCVCVAMLVYFNSDSYKIKKSVELIINGDTVSAMKVVYDVYDPQANAIKDFILVENAKDEFVKNMENGSDLQTVNNSFLSFREALYDFDSVEYKYALPQELTDLYNMYNAAVPYAENVAYGSGGGLKYSLNYIIGGVQSVFLNKPQRNQSSKGGDTFTLEQMDKNIDSTTESRIILEDSNYLSYITVDDYKVKEFCYTDNGKIPTGDDLYDMLFMLCLSAYSETLSEINYINDNKEKWDMDDKLYLVSPDSSITSEISSDFEPIKNSGHVNNNTDKVLNILKCDLLYYMLTGNVSTKDY